MQIEEKIIVTILESEAPISIVYGENNSGKSVLLRQISEYKMNENLRMHFMNSEIVMCNLIPTNRLKLRDAYLKDYPEFDKELKIRTLYDKNLNDYDAHLAVIRQMVGKSESIRYFVESSINEIFNIEDYRYDVDDKNKLSDGIENVVNILNEIIWTLIEGQDYKVLDFDSFIELIQSKKVLVMIDEIEMFLHVSIQVRFIDFLVRNFMSTCFIFTTHSPLLLSRVRFSNIYEITDGNIELITEDLYYQNLDDLYNSYFRVETYPLVLSKDIEYIHNVIDGDEEADIEKIEKISNNLSSNYMNIFISMNQFLLIAKRKCK